MNPPAVRIDVDGTITPLPDLAYESLKAALDGGWLEPAPVENEAVTIWIDEEGKIKGLPLNPLANVLWEAVGDLGCIAAGDYLVGPAVITGGVDDEGDTLPVPQAVLDLLNALPKPMWVER